MAIQLSTGARNARLDAIEVYAGNSAVLTIWSGTAPANCAAANTGTKLVSMTLPVDWMSDASAGSKAKTGTWEDASADNSGTAGYFRIHSALGAAAGNCVMQGTVGVSSGDLRLSSVTITAAQDVVINALTWTDGNA
jgi:hypothetical protein